MANPLPPQVYSPFLAKKIGFCFKIICVGVSFCSDDLHSSNKYHLPDDVIIHQIRENSKRDSCITNFIYEELIIT